MMTFNLCELSVAGTTMGTGAPKAHEYLEGGIILRIPITPTLETWKKALPAGAEKKRD